MPRFFMEHIDIEAKSIVITGRDAEHIKVLRMRNGEALTICDGKGTDLHCVLTGSDGKTAYAMRAYVSTFIGQFFDNFLFSIMVFTVFAPIFWDGFSWTVLQCAMCALTGAVAELIMEILFSPIGYRITRYWSRQRVGKDYLEYIA